MPYKEAQDYRKYMRVYMKDYRKVQREAIREARKVLGFDTRVRKTQRRHKK